MTRIVKKPTERRAEIIQAAKRLFQTQEYEKTSMQEIMDELQIAKGTIYHYFASKEALFEAVIEDIAQENCQTMQKQLAAPGNALEKMKRLVEAGRIATDNPHIMQTLHNPANQALHTRLLATLITKQAPLYAELIRQGSLEGHFTTDQPLECAEFILSAVQFLTDTGIYPWSQQDLERRAKALPKLIEQLLQATPGSFDFLFKLIN